MSDVLDRESLRRAIIGVDLARPGSDRYVLIVPAALVDEYRAAFPNCDVIGLTSVVSPTKDLTERGT